MPFHDLNIPYTATHSDLSQTLDFAAELGYSTVAIAVAVNGKLPPQPQEIPLAGLSIPDSIQVLKRLTLTISDTTQNHRLASLQSAYDIVALRPTNEDALKLCCGSLDCDLISIDFSTRLQFIIKFKTVGSALSRGIRFEICYSPGVAGSNDARRNLISGATTLIRATRGRGIVISSEAKNALGLRAPWDAVNLARVWGLSQERGKEAVCEESGKVVRLAGMKRTSFRGVVDIIDNGSVPVSSLPLQSIAVKPIQNRVKGDSSIVSETSSNSVSLPKRKASSTSLNSQVSKGWEQAEDKPLSKREIKRRAKKVRVGGNEDLPQEKQKVDKSVFPLKHEALLQKKKG